jgi:heptosyltransferase III
VREPARSLAAATRLRPLTCPAVDDLLGPLGGPVLAIHVGAGARRKRWDAAGFVQVAHWWRQCGGAVVEIGGPAEAADPPLLGAPVARSWPLPDLAALLGRATAYLGNDSGVSHLAGAAGATGLALFGPGQAHRWRPLGGRLATLEARAAGPDGLGLAALSVSRVIAAMRRRIALTGRYPDISVPA